MLFTKHADKTQLLQDLITECNGSATIVLELPEATVEIDGVQVQVKLLVVPKEKQARNVLIVGHPCIERPYIKIVLDNAEAGRI